MEKKFKKLNLESWKRRAAFDYFSSFEDPFFNICSNLDVTHLHSLCKKNGYSFNLAIHHYSLGIANEMEAFRMRIVGEEVVIFDRVNCGSTVLHEDETFSFCYFEWKESLEAFVEDGEKRIAHQLEKKELDPKVGEVDMIHYSVIPWISFTSFKHAKKNIPGDSIPKIVFGKFFEENGKVLLPISVAVNHALMDGFHVGKYLNKLQEALSGPG